MSITAPPDWVNSCTVVKFPTLSTIPEVSSPITTTTASLLQAPDDTGTVKIYDLIVHIRLDTNTLNTTSGIRILVPLVVKQEHYFGLKYDLDLIIFDLLTYIIM